MSFVNGVAFGAGFGFSLFILVVFYDWVHPRWERWKWGREQNKLRRS